MGQLDQKGECLYSTSNVVSLILNHEVVLSTEFSE